MGPAVPMLRPSRRQAAMLPLPQVCALFAVLLQLALPSESSRVLSVSRLSSKKRIAPDRFGIRDMIADRRPEEEAVPETFENISAVILERLGDVEKGAEENLCMISHEEILDEKGAIFEGGLVAVVQRHASYRVNFYRMQKFRDWVRIKPLDIGSNQKFADERDVWVVRLLDGSAMSDLPLPDLDGVPRRRARGRGTQVTPEREARRDALERREFLTDFPIPAAGQEQLIPSMVPHQHEIFTFRFSHEVDPSRAHNTWEWDLTRIHLGANMEDLTFGGDFLDEEDGRTFLRAHCNRCTGDIEWIVTDANNRTLFRIESYQRGEVYKLFSLAGSAPLFTIVIDDDAALGANERGLYITVLSGDGQRILYTSQRERTIARNDAIFFYRGSLFERYRPVGVVPFRDTLEGRRTLTSFSAHNSADSALLLVASAVATV
eukprot:TRINITY_DN14329_c0_g2_i1.p1 TRINITY_DN14329_c0_g2~~TRINITY_DN14329_c0_g2_i1.p1  ORF type:complete len:454 (-),score=52.95 TRINITY_DN14329_c0_g2_i1:252-1553(-)